MLKDDVAVEYIVLRNNVDFSHLTAYRGGGAGITVTSDAQVKWTLSGKFEVNSEINYLTDQIQPILTLNGNRWPLKVCINRCFNRFRWDKDGCESYCLRPDLSSVILKN